MVCGKLVSGSERNEEMQQMTEIRNAVLKEELHLPIQEDMDAFCMYALAYEGDKAVATGGISFDGEVYRIQEVAVLAAYRKKKYGDFIVRLLIDKAMMSGAQVIEADIIKEAMPLFESIGFTISGEMYEKEGKIWAPMQLLVGSIHKCCNCGH